MPHKKVKGVRETLRKRRERVKEKRKQKKIDKIAKARKKTKTREKLREGKLSGLDRVKAAPEELKLAAKEGKELAEEVNPGRTKAAKATKAAARYASTGTKAAGGAFDRAFAVDSDGDGTVEADEVMFGLDLNNDGEFGGGEIFEPVEAPRDDAEANRGKRQPRRRDLEVEPPDRRGGRNPRLDDFLVGGEPEDSEANNGLDDYLI